MYLANGEYLEEISSVIHNEARKQRKLGFKQIID